MTFSNGQRVNTPKGPGTVSYQRLAPPDYTEAQSVSVILDSRKEDFKNGSYSGTVFLATQVTVIT